MSIEVLTRRIERLKHHIQQLGDGTSASTHHSLGTGKVGGSLNTDLAPLKHQRVGSAGRQQQQPAAAGPSRLPNASFGGGPSLVSRQRQALANAVQQAATKGVTQIRDELQAQETQLYDTLLEKYVALCDYLVEAPDSQFFGSNASDVTTTRASSSASSSSPELYSRVDDDNSPARPPSAAHSHQLPAAAASAFSGGNRQQQPTSPLRSHHSSNDHDTSAVSQQSHSIVGLDSSQRNRNAKVEQLAVACQVLISRRRRFDMLDAKMRDVDVAVLRFNETLVDCHRLWRKASSSSSGMYHNAGSEGASFLGNNRATKLTPIGAPAGVGAGGGRRPSLSPGRTDLNVDPHIQPSGMTPRLGGKSLDTPGESSSIKILHAKVNDAQAEIRSAVVRLLLYLNDIIVEAGEQQPTAVPSVASTTDAGRQTKAAGTIRPTSSVISSVLLERKQAALHEKLVRHCQQIRTVFGDAPEFCPPSLGIVCSTPLLMDVTVFATLDNELLRGRGASRTGSAGSANELQGDIPVAQHRRKSVNSGAADATSPSGNNSSDKRPSIVAIPRKSISFPSSNVNSSQQRQPLIIPRSVKDAEAQGVQRAHDTWLTLANLLAIDIPPTAVPYSKRFVPSQNNHSATQQRPSTPSMLLQRHRQQLHTVNTSSDGLPDTYSQQHPVAHHDDDDEESQQQWRPRRASLNVEESVIAAAAEAAITAISSQPPSPLRPRSTMTNSGDDGDEAHTHKLPSSDPDAPTPLVGDTTSVHVSAITFADGDNDLDESNIHKSNAPQQHNATVAAELDALQLRGEQDDEHHSHAEQSRNNEAVRAMWRARRNLQHASAAYHHLSPAKGKQTPTSPASEVRGNDDYGPPHADRLHAIAEKLHQLEAQRKLLKFARGYVVDGRGAARRRHNQSNSSTPLIDEISVLSAFEEEVKAQHRENGERDWASEADVVGLSKALAERDEFVHRRARDAVRAITRFLRGLVASRKSRERCQSRRSARRVKCAIQSIEAWWGMQLPQRRARQHARRHASELAIQRYNDRAKVLMTSQHAISTITRVGRAFITRRTIGRTYPEDMEAIQKNVIRRALWYKDNQRTVEVKRVASGQRKMRTQLEQRQERATTILQAFARGIAARNRVRCIKSRQLLERRQFGGATIQERLRAARMLQRAWRSYRARVMTRAAKSLSLAHMAQLEHNAARDWAVSRLVGFVSIIEAKREAQRRRRAIAAREKEERRKARDPARRKAEISAALLGAQKRMQNVVDSQTNRIFLSGLGGGADTSAIAQRQIQRILKIDHASVPKLDLEANFLSNVADSAKTIEREDDSFEVRLLHRLMQAPLPLLYVFHNFINSNVSSKEESGEHHHPTSNAPTVPPSNVTSGGANTKKDATPPEQVRNVETDFAVESEDPSTPILHNRTQPVRQSGDKNSDSDSEGDRTPRCLAQELDDDDESCSPDAENPSVMPAKRNSSSANGGAIHAYWQATSIISSRLSCRGHGEYLLEDKNGVPRAPSTTEPFARWTIAHSVLRHIFDEAATYAWKMIFSHTIHDAQKQASCATVEEREARLGRVQQRNALILACYDCGSEKEWLSQARKNIGFIGKIWTPIKYLEGDTEEDLEERALQSYRFTDDFLLQCFPNAYSLRDVPELLVACGIYRVLKKAVTGPLTDLGRFAPADPVQVTVHRGRTTEQHVLAGLRKFDGASSLTAPHWSDASTTSLIDNQFRTAAETCALRSLETLAQLQKMSDGCFSPTVTTAPSRRAHPLEDDEQVELSNVNGDEDEDADRGDYDDEDDEDDEDDNGLYGHPRGDEARFDRDDIPDRSDTRLGFIDENDDDDDEDDREENVHLRSHPLGASHSATVATPSTTTSDPGLRFPTSDSAAATPADDDACNDSERDEELARQILLEQPGGPLNTPPEEFSDFPRSGRADDDDALAGTGRGNNIPPPANDDDDNSDGSDGESADPCVTSIHVTFRSSFSTEAPTISIHVAGALEMLGERLAITLTDTRTDHQMLEDI